jgi:hypothetical protein
MSAQFSQVQVSEVGFAYSPQRLNRRSAMFAELVATVGLIVSIMVVVAAVSIGIARAAAPALNLMP